MSGLQQFMRLTAGMLQVKARPGFDYSSVYEYVLKNGQDYSSQVMTDIEVKRLERAVKRYRRDFPIKQCFYNSQMLLTFGFDQSDENDVFYVEGYSNAIIPIQHGWLSLNGKVIDLTMRLNKFDGPFTRKLKSNKFKDRVIGEFPDNREYFGVKFTRSQVQQFMLQTETAGSMIDDWERGYPLLKSA